MEEPQLEIIYEDENLATVNKPYGVNFDWALNERSDLLPVHRLDKDTSGIILFAKNTVTAEYLKKLFREREIKKTYLTLVVGAVKDCEGKIELAIGRSKKTPLKRVAIGEQRGKIRHAVTGFKVLKKFASGHPTSAWMSDVQASFTLVEAYPKTGRTHQIRSHFAAIGHPVVCDKLYAGKKFVCPGKLTRQFLHAAALEFTLPSGGRLKLEADLPKDLEDAIFFLCQH